MRNQRVLTLCGIVFMLCMGVLARGQTPITINGSDTVCKNNIESYSITTTPGISYTWNVTVAGSVVSTSTVGSTQSTDILWTGVGPATITVMGYNSGMALVQLGTKNVYVVNPPNIFLTSSAQVACTELDSVTYDLRDEEGCAKYCEFSQVTYTANGDETGSFHWNVTGAVSFTPMGNTVVVNWGAAGFGSITVTDTSEFGCIVTVTKCIEIIARPNALFGTQPLAVNDTVYICDSTNVVFTDSSTGSNTSPIVSWLWNFGDGTTSTQPGTNYNPLSHQYTGPGTFLATLVVTNLCGCSDTDSVWVVVAPEVGVQIQCPSVVCEFDTATYSVASCGTWDVTGGTVVSSNATTVVVVWDNVGISGFGYVTFTPSAACAPLCPQPTTIKVPVVKQNGTITGPVFVCPYTAYVYKLPQWPSTEYNWYVTSSNGAVLSASDQPNEIILNSGYATGTPQNIVLKVNYKNTLLGCGGLATINITVLPLAYITGPETVCLNSNATYNLSPGSYTGDWTLTYPDNSTATATGTNTFNGTFNQVGTYYLTLTSPTNSFCPPTPVQINVYPPPPPPDAINGPTIICRGVPLQYTATNSIPGTIFVWAAVNGSVTPTSGDVTYATFLPNSGPFSIMVWREETANPHCPSDTLILPLDTPIVTPVIAGQDTVCPSTYEPYTAGYMDGEAYFWEILPPYENSGSISPVNGSPNVTILWNDMGSSGLAVKLGVRVRKCTGWYVDTMDVFIRGIPSLSLSIPDTACADDIVNMSLLPSNIVGTGTVISWDFGDGVVQTGGVNITHVYTTFPGTGPIPYTVTVTVTNPYGCTGTYVVSDQIYIKPSPVAYISPAGPHIFCDQPTFSVPLNATIQSGYGTATNYAWYWSGNSLPFSSCLACTTQNITETNYGLGNYFVIVTNSFGCSDTTNIVQFREDCPDTCEAEFPIDFTIDVNMVACGEVKLTGNEANEYYGNWYTPGAATTTGGNPATVTYDVAGIYSATYVAAVPSADGDTCFADTTVSYLIPYIADLLYDITCDVGNPGYYKVTLIDHSSFFPGIGLTYTFKINGSIVQSSTTLTTYTTSLPFGTYTLGLEITDGSYFTCTDNAIINIPHWPVANFTWYPAPNPICAIDTGAQFTNLSTGTGLSFWWTFGDGSSNSQANPNKVWANGGNKTVVLTATDEYGCTDQKVQIVQVVPDVLVEGYLTKLPNTACEGNPITLQYNPMFTIDYPTNYQWMLSQSVYGYTTVPSKNVFTTGAYWAIGTNANYCKVVTDVVPVNFVEVPEANITGDNYYCTGEQMALSAYAGPGPISYFWSVDGGPWIPGTSEWTTTYYSPGVHTFQVKIRVPDGLGGFCEDISGIVTVTIYPPPPPPVVTFNMIDCPSYMLEFNGSNIVPGTYNWSNGLSGTPVYVFQGGDYICLFTDQNGCQSSKGFSVPKDPDTYLWTFPTGCYNFCDLVMPRTIVGPIIPFDYWAYLKNMAPDLTGTYSVPLPYVVTSSGQYNLVLDNGLCADTSGNMHLTVDTCRPCGVPPFIKLVSVWQTGDPLLGPECFDSLMVQIMNAGPGNMGYSVTAMNGMLIPHSGSVPAGVTNVKFRYVADPGFTGPTDVLIFTITMPDGSICIQTIKVEIRPCGNEYAPKPVNGTETQSGDIRHAAIADGARMLLVPNPAGNSTRVDYSFADGRTRQVELYDLAGRRLALYEVKDATGSVQLQLEHYASGMYMVLIRENGKLLLQSKLSVIK
ncbi:MAG: PKD domain-containing protein [Flavipsychrobacter sp.]|nr:PKD domain-containing protein [Flavipsychrobacter sp.]